jgi:hypothetical protein
MMAAPAHEAAEQNPAAHRMSTYSDYIDLRREFVQQVGYAGRAVFPDDLIHKLAAFLDAHASDSMVSYYAQSLLSQFYRLRTRGRSVRLFDALHATLRDKGVLIDLFLLPWDRHPHPACVEDYDAGAIWLAIEDLPNDYGKANWIGRFAHILPPELLEKAYAAVLAFPEPFQARAFGGLFACLDAERQAAVFSYLCEQFRSWSAEAAYQLKLMFPFMSKEHRAATVALHVGMEVPESWTAYLVIRNAQYLQRAEGERLVEASRRFTSAYLRNRCLLKLAAWLPAGEIEALFAGFMDDVRRQAPSSEMIHNLVQFGAVTATLGQHEVIQLALDLIARLDDTQRNLYSQQKYGLLLFILPLLGQDDRTAAFDIALTVRGGYRRGLLGKLRKYFDGEYNFCQIRGAAICY